MSCKGNKTNAADAVGTGDSTTRPTPNTSLLTTKTFFYENADNAASVKVEIDFPTSGDKQLCENIRARILEASGDSYSPSGDDGQAMTDHIGNTLYDTKAEQWNDVDKDNRELSIEGTDMAYSPQPPYSSILTAKKIDETDTFVTYDISIYEYTGGAHGETHATGVTFSKIDGIAMTYRTLKDNHAAGLSNMIKEGLKSYFKDSQKRELNDSELADRLIFQDGTTIDNLPLPEQGVFITRKGVTFRYGQYEIAPYAAGMPEFTVDYNKIKPYLTKTAIELLDK